MNLSHPNHSQHIPQVTALCELHHVCKPCYEIIGKLFKRELYCRIN
eukprot:UN06572